MRGGGRRRRPHAGEVVARFELKPKHQRDEVARRRPHSPWRSAVVHSPDKCAENPSWAGRPSESVHSPVGRRLKAGKGFTLAQKIGVGQGLRPEARAGPRPTACEPLMDHRGQPGHHRADDPAMRWRKLRLPRFSPLILVLQSFATPPPTPSRGSENPRPNCPISSAPAGAVALRPGRRHHPTAGLNRSSPCRHVSAPAATSHTPLRSASPSRPVLAWVAFLPPPSRHAAWTCRNVGVFGAVHRLAPARRPPCAMLPRECDPRVAIPEGACSRGPQRQGQRLLRAGFNGDRGPARFSSWSTRV